MLELMKRKRRRLGNWLRRNCLLKDALEGMAKRGESSLQKKISDDRHHYDRLYEDTKRKTEKRVEWSILSLQWKTCPWADYD